MAGRQMPHFVGRATEFLELDGELRAVATGGVGVVVLLGDAGVGKTRLAREFLTRHRSHALGLSARAYPLAATASYSLWTEALEQHLRRLEPAQVRAACGAYGAELGSLFGSIEAHVARAEREPSRLRLFEGLTVLVESLARPRPLVIAFDDVHLADVSSLEALSYVARNARAGRALFVLTARRADLAEQRLPSEILGALEQESTLRRVELAPLVRRDLAELARDVLTDPSPPDAVVDWLLERSRGIPLFAVGLLHALVEEDADLTAPRLSRLPEDLAERVRLRLAHLDQASLAVLELLALLGHRAAIADLVRFARRPLEELAPVLGRLTRSRLVTEEERGRELTYEIAHPLIQQTIYESIGAARRRALDRMLGQELLSLGRLREAAPHFARSADRGEPEAIAALRDAVQEAERREEYGEALTLLNALVDLVPAGDRRWLEIVDALSWQAEWVVDHRADIAAEMGVVALREIDSLLAKTGDPARRAAVQFRLASFLAWGSGELEEAERSGQAARELYERAGDRASALLAANELAWIRGMLIGDLARHEALAGDVAEAAAHEGHAFVEMQARGSLGWAALCRGRFDRSERALRRSIEIARSEEKGYRLTWNLATLALSLALDDQVTDAPSLLEEARAVNPAYRETILLEWEAIVWWLAGDYDRAVELGREVLAANAGVLPRRRGLGIAVAAIAALETGTPLEARRLLAPAQAAYRGRDWAFFSTYCSYAEALITAREGELVRAVELLEQVVSTLLHMDARTFAAFPLLDLAELAPDASAQDTAAAAAAQLLENVARDTGPALYRGLAALARASVHLTSGDTSDASESAAQAATLFEGAYRGLEARARFVHGRSLADSDPQAALEELEKAVSIFAGCGARTRRDRAVTVLRDLGHRGRRAADRALGIESLTPRELQVLSLLGEGLSNAEIAGRLVISPKTAEHHVGRILAKLDVKSRVQAAALAARNQAAG